MGTSWLQIPDIRRIVFGLSDPCTELVLSHLTGDEPDVTGIVNMSLKYGYFNVLAVYWDWYGFPVDSPFIRIFGEYLGIESLLVKLLNRKSPNYAMYIGALTGNLDVVKKFDPNKTVILLAALCGHVELLEYCESAMGVPLDNSVFQFVSFIDNNHTYTVMTWAHSRGYRFSPYTLKPLLYSDDVRLRELVAEHMFDDIVELDE